MEDARTRIRDRDAHSDSLSAAPPRAGYRDPRTGHLLTGDIRERAHARPHRRAADASHAPTRTRHEEDEVPRLRVMRRSSSYAHRDDAESTTGVSRRNEEYSRIINHQQCDQTLLGLCIRAIHIKQQRTGQMDGEEEFLWRCLAQPEDVRSRLKAEDIHIPRDPVKHLIQKAGDFKRQWMPEVRSTERWKSACASCGHRPFVSWDACFRSGSLAGTT